MRARVGTLAGAVAALLIGALVATGINGALGISFTDKDLPDQGGFDIPEISAAAPIEPVAAIQVLPDSAWVKRSAKHLADALHSRTGERPELTENRPKASSAITVRIDEAALRAGTYRIEDTSGLQVRAADATAAAAAYYKLARELTAGATMSEAAAQEEPAMPMRLVDLGGIGVPTEPWNPTNYSHNTRRFARAINFQPPYVDEEAFGEVTEDFIGYVDRMRLYGNTGLVAGGFSDLITFDKVGDGFQIYGPDSPYRLRHEAIGEHKRQLWQIADAAGMDVYLSHTELALTPPLKRYLQEHAGSLDATDADLWEVYQQGLAELFEKYPSVDGVMIRVGEAGEIYDPQSQLRYSTRLAVDTDEAVQQMLTAFLEVAAEYDRDIIFRSWTVGIGEVGAMHTDAEVYQRVLGEIDSPHLVVSTKYAEGDFYRFLPSNETLETGGQRRIIEMQDRLEYEGFMAFPDMIAGAHSAALAHFGRSNPHVEGVWHWTQNGGPQQAGPRSLYPFEGIWLNIDANVYTTSRMAADPSLEPGEAAADWVRLRFGDDPEVIRPLTQMLALSGRAATRGLYISAFAEERVLALGLEPPPMLWIFEWDIVSGSNSVLSVVYHLSRDRVEAMVTEGQEAVALAQRMRALVEQVDPATVRDPQLLGSLAASIDYEISLLRTLSTWRTTALRYYQWLDTGEGSALEQWHKARGEFAQVKADHLQRYGDDLDHPAYNFFAVEQGLAHMDRDAAMSWMARGLLLLAVLAVAGVLVAARRGHGAAMGWARMVMGAWRRGGPGPASGGWILAAVIGVWVLASFLAFSAFLSWHFPVLLSMMCVVFIGVLTALTGRAGPAGALVVLARLSLVCAVFLAVMAVRGPGMFWLIFWTRPALRTVMVVAVVALLLWTICGAWRVSSRQLTSRVRGSGSVLVAGGAVLLAMGIVPAIAGLEAMLTGLNNQMAILPMGLSMILGITEHLGIPDTLPRTMMIVGGACGLCGLLVLLVWRRRLPQLARKSRP